MVLSLSLSLFCPLLWAWLDYQNALSKKLVDGHSVMVEIAKGDSFSTISGKLAQQLPIDPFWFKVLALQGNAFKKIKTGEYELTSGLTLPDILALLVAGKTKHYVITFPEGWTFQQVYLAIAQNPHLEHTVLDQATLMSRLAEIPWHPEGAFFPDTYFFEKHTSDVALLQKAYAKMQTVIAQEWQNKADNLPYKNSYEALIMASIIEKETADKAERRQIAGVFVRRLRLGMRLQTDPTVIYGMGDRYQGNITANDLKLPTPYNTYVINGLPPTPIAMPGREAINAALHPDDSDNIYFVARGDGSHVFSASLQAHNLAVDSYQRKRK
jgi:UPF0755 protein